MRLGRNHAVLAAAAIVIGALLVPAMSQAASLQLLSRGKITVNKHFHLSMTANQGQKANPPEPASPTTLDLTLSRGTETANFDFFAGITFTGKQNMKAAHLRGTLAKHRGRVAMAFKAQSRVKKVRVPKGCTGTAGSKRDGVLTGKFRLGADHLGTVRLKRMRATLEKPPVIDNCSGGEGGGFPHGTSVEAFKGTEHSNLDVNAFKPRGHGKVSESVSVGKNAKAYSFNWFITSNVSRSLYKFSSNLTTATLRGAGRLGGVAKYKGKHSGPSGSNATEGKMGGSTFVAHFATLGNVRPFRKSKFKGSQTKF